MGNRDTFQKFLIEAYRDLFANDPDYEYVRGCTTPEELAEKMTTGLARGSANKDAKAVKIACKAVGIRCTYKAIMGYLNGP